MKNRMNSDHFNIQEFVERLEYRRNLFNALEHLFSVSHWFIFGEFVSVKKIYNANMVDSEN